MDSDKTVVINYIKSAKKTGTLANLRRLAAGVWTRVY
jgi:hypothetical protein